MYTVCSMPCSPLALGTWYQLKLLLRLHTIECCGFLWLSPSPAISHPGEYSPRAHVHRLLDAMLSLSSRVYWLAETFILGFVTLLSSILVSGGFSLNYYPFTLSFCHSWSHRYYSSMPCNDQPPHDVVGHVAPLLSSRPCDTTPPPNSVLAQVWRSRIHISGDWQNFEHFWVHRFTIPVQSLTLESTSRDSTLCCSQFEYPNSSTLQFLILSTLLHRHLASVHAWRHNLSCCSSMQLLIAFTHYYAPVISYNYTAESELLNIPMPVLSPTSTSDVYYSYIHPPTRPKTWHYSTNITVSLTLACTTIVPAVQETASRILNTQYKHPPCLLKSLQQSMTMPELKRISCLEKFPDFPNHFIQALLRCHNLWLAI
jgi:hypothetical protein